MSLRTIPEVSEIDADLGGFRPTGSTHKRNGIIDLSMKITTSSPIPLIVEELCGSPDSFRHTFKSLSPSFPTPPSLSAVPDLLHSSPSSPSSSYSDFPDTPAETPSQSLENLTVPKPSRPTVAPLFITKHAFKGIVDFSNSPLLTADSRVSFMDADDSDLDEDEDDDWNDGEEDGLSFYSEQLSARITLASPSGFPSTPMPYSPLPSAELPPARRDSCNSVVPANPAKPPPSARSLPKTPRSVKRPSSALDPDFVFAKPASRRPPRVELPADILEEDDSHFGLGTASRMSGLRMNFSMRGNDVFFDTVGSASRPTSTAATLRPISTSTRHPRPSVLSIPPLPSLDGRSLSPLDIPTTAASISSFDFTFAPTTPLPPMNFDSVSPFTTISTVKTPVTSYPPSAFPHSSFPESAITSANDSELQAQQQASLLRSRWSTSTVSTLPQNRYAPPRISTQELPKTPISASPGGLFRNYFSRKN